MESATDPAKTVKCSPGPLKEQRKKTFSPATDIKAVLEENQMLKSHNWTRGSRAGQGKQRQIPTVVGHRPARNRSCTESTDRDS